MPRQPGGDRKRKGYRAAIKTRMRVNQDENAAGGYGGLCPIWCVTIGGVIP